MNGESHGRTPRLTRRCWLQFSLRSLLFLTLVVAPILALTVNRASLQRRAVAEIERLGGRVVRSPGWGPGWLRSTLGEDYFSDVEVVDVFDPAPFDFNRPEEILPEDDDPRQHVSDQTLGMIAGLPKVRVVRVGSAYVTDEGLRHLSQASTITELSIAGSRVRWDCQPRIPSKVTDEGISHLARLPNLEILYVHGNVSVDSFAALPVLRELELSVPELNRLGSLDGFAKLESLSLWCDSETVHRPLERLDEMGRRQGLRRISFRGSVSSDTWNPQLGRRGWEDSAHAFQSRRYQEPVAERTGRTTGVVGFVD